MSEFESIFNRITSDARYRANLDWGEPREGHPEGTIRAHIEEMEGNLESLRPKLTSDEDWKLKILIHTHDTFKPDAQEGIAIAHPSSHASRAKAFLAEFTNDADLLDIVQYHDEPFALYRQQQHRGKFNQHRFDQLLNRIEDWNLYHAFLIIDGSTAGKSREALEWWFSKVRGRIDSTFSVADIIRV